MRKQKNERLSKADQDRLNQIKSDISEYNRLHNGQSKGRTMVSVNSREGHEITEALHQNHRSKTALWFSLLALCFFATLSVVTAILMPASHNSSIASLLLLVIIAMLVWKNFQNVNQHHRDGLRVRKLITRIVAEHIQNHNGKEDN